MSENMDSPDVDLKDANPVDDGVGKSFTQAEVDKIIEQRLSRERKRFDKATEGIDLNEAKQLMEQRDQLELERKKDRGEFEDVLKTTVAKKEGTIQALQARLHQIQVEGSLLSAASNKNAVSPEQVSSLLKSQIRLSDDGTVEVIDNKGTIRYNDGGELLSVQDLMTEFLTANPHFVRATSGGAGSGGAAGGSTQKPTSVADMLSNWDNGGRDAFAASKKRK